MTGLPVEIPKEENQKEQVAAPEPVEFIDLFKSKCNFNELNEQSMKYLYSNDDLFSSKDIKFLKSTLLGLTNGDLMTI